MRIAIAPKFHEASAEQLASHYKFERLGRQESWSRFVNDRLLSPGIDAKEFYRLYDAAEPVALAPEYVEVAFSPTHMDTLSEDSHKEVQIRQEKSGVYRMVWAFGMTGSHPPTMPPDPSRFIPLAEYQSQL